MRFLVICILKKVKATGGDEMPHRECVEGEKKARNGILEKPHGKEEGNTQRRVEVWELKEKERVLASRSLSAV